ncbi:MAG: hypothetical protein LJE74_09265 [Proteobacteria bacterium]|jgi:hypothetical protein|nr:hypothetical protein [Pseudomonadota bacterium]
MIPGLKKLSNYITGRIKSVPRSSSTSCTAPGVYIEASPLTLPTIEMLDMSVTGYIGASGVTDTTPVKLASWLEFETRFGRIEPANLHLAHAVAGFFAHGGRSCWVAPLVSTTPTAVAQALQSLEDKVEIGLLAALGLTKAAVQQQLLSHGIPAG